MQELKGEERGTSPYYQYKDLATGFRFIHDFHRPIDGKRVFDKVHKQYVKRIKRLYERIEKSSRIFILLNSRWRIRRELVEDFHAMLETKWPRKIFTIVVVSFSQTIDEKFVLGDYGMIYNYAREENSYDYFQTNFEWEFLDRIELRQNDVSKKRYIDIKKTRHGLRVYVLSNKRNLFGFRIRIMGLELDISLGNAAS
jgi:hypothetical protein